MVLDKKIGIIGTGHLGKSLLYAWLNNNIVDQKNVTCSVGSQASLDLLQSELELANYSGVKVTLDNDALIENSDIIYICLKPDIFRRKLAYSGFGSFSNKIVISTCVSVTFSEIVKSLNRNRRYLLYRMVPNLACQVGHGIVAVLNRWYPYASNHESLSVLHNSLGRVYYFDDESKMDAFVAAGSSSIAFAALLLEAMADGGVLIGLSRQEAVELAAQTALGTAMLILDNSSKTDSKSKLGQFASLKESVCTPNGCTIRGIQVLEKSGVRGHIIDAIKAAFNFLKIGDYKLKQGLLDQSK